MNTGNFLDEMAYAFTAFVAGGLKQWFGDDITLPVLGPVTGSDFCVAGCFVLLFFILHGITAIFLKRKAGKAEANAKHLKRNFLGALGKPLYLLIWIFGIYISLTPFLLRLPQAQLNEVRGAFDTLFDLSILAAALWFFLRFTRVLEAHLAAWAAKTRGKLDDFLVPLVASSLRIIGPVLAVIFAMPIIFPAKYQPVFASVDGILIVLAVASILMRAIHIGEMALLAQYDITVADNLRARKIYTQARLISRTLQIAVGVCAIASVLMLFQSVRHIGASLLASAGIVGIIAGVAAQKTLANLIAGFQIALAQPIRQDDVVIVEGEWGRIEEITLAYVVVKIWDERRLVLPLTYFIEKPFQNWTRATAQLLGSVFVWVDYSFPVEEGRKALKEIIENHPLWDKRFWNLQVTDADQKTMQLRVLATSADASKSWDLRCAVREQFIAYIQKNHPQSLPQVRAQIANINPPPQP